MNSKVIYGFDILKLQKDILNQMFKGKNIKWLNVEVQGKKYIAVTLDGYVLYLVPEKSFYIDQNLLSRLCKPNLFIENLINDFNNAKKLNDTKMFIELDYGMGITKIFENEDQEKIYINTKLLNSFDKSVNYLGNKSTDPVCLTYLGEPIGMIMPIKRRKENAD